MPRNLRLPAVCATFIAAAIVACESNDSTGPDDVRGYSPVAAMGSSKGQEAQCDTILITAPTTTIAVGGTVQLTAHPYTFNGHGKELDKATVTWSSFNSSVAAVNSTGLVTGVSSGSTIIHATCSATTGTGDLQINVQ